MHFLFENKQIKKMKKLLFLVILIEFNKIYGIFLKEIQKLNFSNYANGTFLDPIFSHDNLMGISTIKNSTNSSLFQELFIFNIDLENNQIETKIMLKNTTENILLITYDKNYFMNDFAEFLPINSNDFTSKYNFTVPYSSNYYRQSQLNCSFRTSSSSHILVLNKYFQLQLISTVSQQISWPWPLNGIEISNCATYISASKNNKRFYVMGIENQKMNIFVFNYENSYPENIQRAKLIHKNSTSAKNKILLSPEENFLAVILEEVVVVFEIKGDGMLSYLSAFDGNFLDAVFINEAKILAFNNETKTLVELFLNNNNEFQIIDTIENPILSYEINYMKLINKNYLLIGNSEFLALFQISEQPDIIKEAELLQWNIAIIILGAILISLIISYAIYSIFCKSNINLGQGNSQININNSSIPQRSEESNLQTEILTTENDIINNSQVSIKHALFCPLTKRLINVPVIASDGYTYERSAITAWLEKNNESPITKKPLESKELLPNIALEKLLAAIRRNVNNVN